MTTTAASGNEEQARLWNEVAGPLWVERQALLDRMIGAFGARAVDGAGFAPGESVLDVGCGTGQTTVEAARRVAPGGRVLGVDLSGPMLEGARRRAAASSPPVPIDFAQGDAQILELERGAFDVVFSRFGVMFFADPVAAFANLRGALRPSGRLVFLCWQTLARNPWVTGPVGALRPVLPSPPPQPQPGAPGPFSLGDQERVSDILARAGFRDVAHQEIEDLVVIGDGSVGATVDFLVEIGPSATLLKGTPPETRAAARSALEDYFTGIAASGKVALRGAAWLVSARPAAT